MKKGIKIILALVALIVCAFFAYQFYMSKTEIKFENVNENNMKQYCENVGQKYYKERIRTYKYPEQVDHYINDEAKGQVENCYTAIAVKNNNTKICKQINDEDSMQLCYLNVAWINKNPQTCLVAEAGYWKDYCYTGLITGGYLKDRSLCDNIQKAGDKEYCYNLFH